MRTKRKSGKNTQANLCRFFLAFLYLCLAVHLSRCKGWDPINWFNPKDC